MSSPHRTPRLVPAILAIAVVSCSPSVDSEVSPAFSILPIPLVAPKADSPDRLLRLFEWSWRERDLAHYRTLFTNDFRFVFGANDPDGNAWRDNPWTRENELASFACIVNGGGPSQAPASNLWLFLDRNFDVEPDPGPGKDPRWHKFVRTSVSLRIVTNESSQVSGFANFFLVRGDSASIPAELLQRGIRPDSTCWYIERWEDDTYDNGGARAMPTRKKTWGSIKALCL